jgi:hypothetical protein
MSSFTDQERDAEKRRRVETDRPLAEMKFDCVHCGRPVPQIEILGGLCDYCLHKD